MTTDISTLAPTIPLAGRADQELGVRAYNHIKDDILRCVLAPGTDLTEAQLSEQYDFGKGPIRSALLRLRHEGLILSERRRGYRVADITLTDVQNVFQLRLLLEPEAARLAAGRLSDTMVARLRQACDVIDDPNGAADHSNFLRANRDFHVGIAEASGNARLAHLIAGLLDDVHRILHLGLSEQPKGDDFQSEHLELLELLMVNQADEAANLVRQQIEGGLAMVMKSFLNRTV